MSVVLFFIAGVGVIAGAIGVIALRNAFYSVLALVVHLLSLAVLFLLASAEFVAAAQVVVYAGAVMVLYVFVVSYVGATQGSLGAQSGRGVIGLSLLFAGALFVCLCVAILGSGLAAIGTPGAGVGAGFGSPRQIGELLLNRFLLPFELASYLLLIAAVGAVVLARRRGAPGGGAEAPPTISAAELLRPRGTGTMTEAVLGLRQAQAAEGPGPGDESGPTEEEPRRGMPIEAGSRQGTDTTPGPDEDGR
ncbi:MAG TPA: NADH-quinone oxidoreductase subunit J [Solirubrobacteraceae bacterium]|nr:NADH-quinone oxidoreductase subunit J [Solirubrobacteraceae bacterium]